MKSIQEIFGEIAGIPHASFHTQELFEYLCAFAKKCGYAIESDAAKNLHAYAKKPPRLCFQSHYDMVGVGEADKPLKLYEADGFLRAKNSSLGADNGIGVASQLYLMQRFDDLEFLFTNNEEVGLLGARNLELACFADEMINLDSETFGEIILGCAGGYDAEVSIPLSKDNRNYSRVFKIVSKGFKGGHSGVDIDKGIKNAIVALAEYLSPFPGGICSFEGGEKNNSIPVFSQAIFKTNELLKSNENFEVEEIASDAQAWQKEPLMTFLTGIRGGMRLKNDEGVIDSLNVSLASSDDSFVKITLMGRANVQELLEANVQEVRRLAVNVDSLARFNLTDFYLPWEKSVDEGDAFLETVKKAFGKKPVRICQIHAGLECGIIAEKMASMGKPGVKILSIGPTILSPHSVNERLDMNDFADFAGVLCDLAQNHKPGDVSTKAT